MSLFLGSLQVTGFEQDEAAVLVFAAATATGEHTVFRGDVLIGADGIKSQVRAQLFPSEGPPTFHGTMLYRGTAHMAPDTCVMPPCTMVVVGTPEQRVEAYPISALAAPRLEVNFVFEKAFEGVPEAALRDWGVPCPTSKLAPLQAWEFPFLSCPGLLDRIQSTIVQFPAVDRDPLARWSFGRVSLMGDAAHPMLPYGSQGANQAILDGVALAEALRSPPRMHAAVARALQTYEAARREPTAKIVALNRERILPGVAGAGDVVPATVLPAEAVLQGDAERYQRSAEPAGGTARHEYWEWGLDLGRSGLLGGLDCPHPLPLHRCR